jgi:DNA-binding NtrC family response regulator
VRELQNCLERAVILADGDTITPKLFNLKLDQFSKPENPLTTLDFSGSLAGITKRALDEVERQAIRHALDETNNDIVRAADRLQIGYKALTTKMKALGIQH